jgi:hypothetical protein
MDDSFSFGKPARRQVGGKGKAPRAPRSVVSAGRPGTGRVAGLVVVGVMAVLAIAGYMAFLKDSGQQIASDGQTAVSQIDPAKDVEAKMTAQQAAGAVQQLYAEQGSFQAITPTALKSFEPSSSYTGGASTGPRVVSVSASSAGVGLAVRSESGTCFLERFAATGVTYATGSTCTGQAAMSANGPSWSA